MKQKRSKHLLPFNELPDIEREKILKFDKRRYDRCPHTLQRIIQPESAYYDRESDNLFISRDAYIEWIKEKRASLDAKRRAEGRTSNRRRRKRAKTAA